MKFRRADGSVLGEIDLKSDIFTISVNDTKIKVKESEGWAVEVGVIDTLFMLDCKKVQIVDKKTKPFIGLIFKISLSTAF